MKINQNVRAVLLGFAIASAATSGAFASHDISLPAPRGQVMTDPCAKVMNWPVRSTAFDATPPSERGLQCPIQDDFTSLWND